MHLTLTAFPCCHSADLTERKIQDCLKIGIEAEFSTTSFQDGKANANLNKCDDVTRKSEGLVFSPFTIPQDPHCCVDVES